MLSEGIKKAVTEILSRHTSSRPTINSISPIGGGCINDAHRVDTSVGRYFVKWNHATRYPGMFESEARGLNLLKGASALRVPEVIGHQHAGTDSLLLLEYIEPASQQSTFWDDFGAGLADLHSVQPADGQFGLDHDNYIGSLPQTNKNNSNWIEFFITERLEVQLRMARDQGKAGKDLSQMFGSLYHHLPDFFPEEPPSLLHGDLWSGNYMTGNLGEAVIIDPAVYYGHRYMDLGMSQLFGGFSQTFYNAYAERYSLDRSWTKSMDIANLYPLMVHVNLFGGSYLWSVRNIVRRFH